MTNRNVTLAFNPTFVPGADVFPLTQGYMNPRVFRLNAAFGW